MRTPPLLLLLDLFECMATLRVRQVYCLDGGALADLGASTRHRRFEKSKLAAF